MKMNTLVVQICGHERKHSSPVLLILFICFKLQNTDDFLKTNRVMEGMELGSLSNFPKKHIWKSIFLQNNDISAHPDSKISKVRK